MITKTRITMPSTQIKTISHTSILVLLSILGVVSIIGVEVVVSILDVVVAVCIVVVGHVIESFLSPGYEYGDDYYYTVLLLLYLVVPLSKESSSLGSV